jgi:hypothetical protein
MTDRPRDFLDRGHIRIALQRDLATGSMTRDQLATKYGASKSGIQSFYRKYQGVIEEIAADLDNRYAGLWIADKDRRVAAYQADVDLVEAETERVLAARDERRALLGDGGAEVDEDGEVEKELTVATDLGRLSRIKHRALRSVAEELGQLPTRMMVKAEEGGAVHFYGIDVDKV